MQKLYEKIEAYFKFDKSDTVVVTVFKSLILLTCGGYLGLILREINSTPSIVNYKHFAVLFIGLIIFIYLETKRLRKEKNFPISILDHLKATEELTQLKLDFSRKNKIDEYIDNSIQSLNSNTCPIVTVPENQLCHQDLNAGLKNVLSDLVDRPNYFFDIHATKFTIGCYLKEVCDTNSQAGYVDKQEKTFIFRDDLFIRDLFPQSLFKLTSNQEEDFQIQVSLLEALKFNKYLCLQIDINNETHTIICSPIPNVCENCPPDGLIFSIFKGDDSCPTDLGNVLLIFGRIVSNWISKYNDCVSREKKAQPTTTHVHKELKIPEEILNLKKEKQ